MLFLILLLLCVFLLYIKVKYRTNHNYWKKQNITHVKDLMWDFFLKNRSMPEVCKSVYDEYDLPHIGTTLGTQLTLLLKSTDDIQAVFASDFQSFYNRGIRTNINDILAQNLLFLNDYNKWKLIRQKLSPTFTSSRLKTMFYMLENCARDFVELVANNKEMRKTPYNFLYTYTTASICASVFGIDTKTKNTMESPFIEMAKKSLSPTFRSNVSLFISSFFPKLFETLKLSFFGEHEEFFVGVVKRVLEDRRNSTDKGRHDFIEICLELQKNGTMQDLSNGYELDPTDELLAAQAFFFFLAGADTTANAMHFTLLELASNQDILAKLHAEIDSIFEAGKKEITYADIQELNYLDMVVSEGMRKYPPIGFIQRICTKDTVLPSNVKIDKGVAVVIPVLALHRDEKYFPDPDKFDPERFRPDNVASINKFAYLPFGEGNRICIGSRLARLQVKAGLAWLLRRFTLAEQENYVASFEGSGFGLRDPKARYDFIARDV